MKKVLPIISVVLIVVLAAVFLMACTPSTLEKAKEKMEKKGYTVGTERLSGLLLADVEGSFAAAKEGSAMTAVLFKSSDAAKKGLETIQKANADAKKAGNWVVYGDEAAIKDFKGL